MQIINCEQGSFEWFLARMGKFTATDASEIKTAGKGLETLAVKKAAEIESGKPDIIPPTSAMIRGKELEPLAREAYERATGQEVVQVGFCVLDDFTGCSPDGLVGEEGLIEIKCKTSQHHFFAVANRWIDPEHKAQMQFQMFVTGRKWCDYVLYCPDFEEHPLYIQTVKRDEEFIEKLRTGLTKGRGLIQDNLRKFAEVYAI